MLIYFNDAILKIFKKSFIFCEEAVVEEEGERNRGGKSKESLYVLYKK